MNAPEPHADDVERLASALDAAGNPRRAVERALRDMANRANDVRRHLDSLAADVLAHLPADERTRVVAALTRAKVKAAIEPKITKAPGR